MGLGYSTGNVNVTLYDDQDGLGPYTLVNVKDWWSDIGMIATSKGRLYPTQKPEELLERIIHVSSNEGDLVADISAVAVTDDAINVGVAALRGEIAQRPSAVSAIKVGGKRAYQRVREGEEVELAARPVHIDRFDVLAIRRDG